MLEFLLVLFFGAWAIGAFLNYKEGKIDKKTKAAAAIDKITADYLLDEKTKAATEKMVKELCSDEEQWLAYKERNIVLGMHIDVVEEIHGPRYDGKRKVTKKANKVTYSYHPFLTKQNNTKYKLEIEYEDNRIVSFEDK